VHQHDRLRVVDGDVAVFAVAHGGEDGEGLFLGVGLAEGVLLGQCVVVVNDADGLLGDGHELIAALGDHGGAVLVRAKATDQNQADP
jgi:hypothetical protein